MKLFKRFALAGLACILWVGVFPSSASATLMRLRVEDLGSGLGIVITDNGAGDQNTAPGQLVFLGSIGSFTINVVAGFAGTQTLDLNGVSVLSPGASTIRYTLEADGFTNPPDGSRQVRADVGGVLSAPQGSTFNLQSYVNPSNLMPLLGTDVLSPAVLAAIGPIPAGSIGALPGTGLTFGPGAFSGTGSSPFTKAGAYALFSQVTVAFSGGGSVAFDDEQKVVPEPTTIALLGIGTLGFGWRRWRAATSI